MEHRPKVSVVVPTYNYARFLPEAIDSVLAQTFTDFELIVVDNCSTDNTGELMQGYLADGRVSFYRNETNLGLVGNWNKCLEYARGEYIKFLCADDKLHPRTLEKFVAVLDHHPAVTIVCSYLEIFGDLTRTKKHKHTGVVSGQSVRKDFIVNNRHNWLHAPTAVMFRKADAAKVGTFNKELFMATDKEYYLRLLSLGDCYVIPEVLSYLRVHGDTQSNLVLEKKYELFFEKYRYFVSIKKHSSPADPLQPHIRAEIKRRAVKCAKVVYKLLPRLYKNEVRLMIKTAFQIGKAEGVLFAPLKYYLWQKLMQKLTKNSKTANVHLKTTL